MSATAGREGLSAAVGGPVRRLVRAGLRIPLFYKLLVANVGIVGSAVIGTARLVAVGGRVQAQGPSTMEWTTLVVAVGIASIVANAVLLRLALSPLRGIEQAARRVSEGKPVGGAPLSIFADRDAERVIRGFNAMLESLTQYRERLRELAARALHAQEAERERVAGELHDDTAQRITAVGFRLSAIQKRLGSGPLADELTGIRAELLDAAEGVQRTARGLRPPALDDLGLAAAIEGYAREMREECGFRVEVTRRGLEMALSPEAELAAYRIVQEAITNARRHADATGVRVVMRGAADFVLITVEDDGCGFDVTATGGPGAKGERLGLLGMQERASYVGAQVEIDSRVSRGTRVEILLPTESKVLAGPVLVSSRP
ncbi:MAG: sensor histidine kinase [Gemmatimonadota bacterium]